VHRPIGAIAATRSQVATLAPEHLPAGLAATAGQHTHNTTQELITKIGQSGIPFDKMLKYVSDGSLCS
jgi:hypothetical protein